MKPRIHIIGGPGTGKTYIARKLAAQLGVTACDLDDLYWDSSAPGYGIKAPVGERDRRLAERVAQPGWIIEGVYHEWLAPSFAAADVIIILTPKNWLRHWRVVRRFGWRKLGLQPGKQESLSDLWRLLRWSHGYDHRQLAAARRFLADHGWTGIDCKNGKEVFAAIAGVKRVWPGEI